MEDDPLPQANQAGRLDCPAAIRSVTLSVPHLGDAAAYFGEGIGLEPSTVRLHTPEHEALWGLAGASTETKLFDGGDVLVELVHYLDPVGKPWPNGYRVSDQGILNIAFGARTKRDFDAIYERAAAFGAKPNGRPIHLPGAGVVYVNDKHGFSVEDCGSGQDCGIVCSDSNRGHGKSAPTPILTESSTPSPSRRRSPGSGK